MTKKLLIQKVKTIALLMTMAVFMIGAFGFVQAQADDPFGVNKVESGELPLSNAEPTEVVIKIINIALGFLALIAVILILVGGFQWMTAGGNDDKVAKAKKLITNGLIGLIIIAASWGIARFAVTSIYNITT